MLLLVVLVVLDGNSIVGDWRLPNQRELQSLIDYANYDPALPSGHMFTNVQNFYWSSTAHKYGSTMKWATNLGTGGSSKSQESTAYYVLPVRSGQ